MIYIIYSLYFIVILMSFYWFRDLMHLYHLWYQLADWNSQDTRRDLIKNLDWLLATLTTQHTQKKMCKSIPSSYLTNGACSIYRWFTYMNNIEQRWFSSYLKSSKPKFFFSPECNKNQQKLKRTDCHRQEKNGCPFSHTRRANGWCTWDLWVACQMVSVENKTSRLSGKLT